MASGPGTDLDRLASGIDRATESELPELKFFRMTADGQLHGQAGLPRKRV
jgi:hypothetical protein